MNTKLIQRAIVALAVLVAGSTLQAQDAGFKVVVNTANAVTTIDRDEASRLFLKKATTWSDGTPVTVVDLDVASAARRAFSKAVLHKDLAAVKSYWQTMVFSGRAVPPPEKPTDAEVVAFVRGHPGAIGYVSASAELGASIKTVAINDRP